MFGSSRLALVMRSAKLSTATRDGSRFVHAPEWAPVGQGFDLGAYVAGELLRKGARDLIDGIPR